MCREMEIMRNQAHEEGVEIGIKKGRMLQLIKRSAPRCRSFLQQRKLQMILARTGRAFDSENYGCSPELWSGLQR